MYGFYESVGSFVGEVAVHDEQRVDGAGDPEKKSKKDIQDKLYRLTTEKNGDGGQNDRKKVSHNYYLPTLQPDIVFRKIFELSIATGLDILFSPC